LQSDKLSEGEHGHISRESCCNTKHEDVLEEIIWRKILITLKELLEIFCIKAQGIKYWKLIDIV
jgi:hypothetical protein